MSWSPKWWVTKRVASICQAATRRKRVGGGVGVDKAGRDGDVADPKGLEVQCRWLAVGPMFATCPSGRTNSVHN